MSETGRMSTVKEGVDELKRRINELTPSARAALVLTVGTVVVFSLVALRLQQTRRVEWFADGRRFSQHEIDRLFDAFSKSNLSGYSSKGGRIRIPRGESWRFETAAAEHRARRAGPQRAVGSD